MKTPRINIFFVSKVILALFDMLALSLAYWLSFTLRSWRFQAYGLVYEPNIRHFYFLCGLTVLILLFFRNQYLYRDVAFRPSTRHLMLLTRSWLIFASLFISISFLFKVRLFIEHRFTVLILIILGWIFLYIGRFLIATRMIRALMKQAHITNRILVIGPASAARHVSQHITDYRDSYNEVAGFIPLDDSTQAPSDTSVPRLGSLSELSDVIAKHGIGEIFINGFGSDWRLVHKTIDTARQSGTVVRVAMPHFGALKERLPNMREVEGDYVYLNNSYFIYAERALKVIFDFAGAGAAVIVLSPLMALVALLIKLDSRGPVFFRQARVGYHGKPFWVLKFRTMKENTEDQHREAIRHLVNEDHEYFKVTTGRSNVMKAAPEEYMTHVGRFLRRTSLDELPQLFNVLTGDMSLVGPRPLPGYEVELFKPWQHLRHTVKPGITGFWQAYARSSVSHQDMVLMDIFYAVNWSFSMDVHILTQTFFVILSGGGAV